MFEALFLLLAPAEMQAAADPLASAKAGKLQCSGPNIEKKTCMGLSRYKVNPDGSFESTTTLIVSPSPLITMEVKSPGKVDKGALCGPIRKADFEAATFQVDGKPAEETMAAAIRPQVVAAIAAMDGKMGCARETPDGAVLKVEVSLDGVAHPEMTQRTLWVNPSDGYKLGI